MIDTGGVCGGGQQSNSFRLYARVDAAIPLMLTRPNAVLVQLVRV